MLKQKTSQLRSLRLACRQYAHLPWLLQHLFRGLRFLASPTAVELSHLSLMLPYVERIVFEPTKYSWAMTRDTFREIVLFRALQPHCAEHDVSEPRLALMGAETFIQDYLQGKPPVDEQELQRHYETYMTHANETKELYDSGILAPAWASVLRKLPNVGMVRIGRWDYTGDEILDAELLSTLAAGQSHRCDHEEHVCRRLQAPVGDAIVSIAFSALHEAGVGITQLDIKCVQSGDFTWADDGSLGRLDLSQTHKLLFRPCCQEIGEYHADEEEQRIGQRCGLALDQLLKRCSPSIKHLEIFPGISFSPMLFPLDAPRPLPALRFLKTGADLRFAAFANLIKDAGDLREVHFDGNHGVRGSGTWRQIWYVRMTA